MQYFIVFESLHSIWFYQLFIISFSRFNITVFVNYYCIIVLYCIPLLHSCHLLSFLSLFLCLSEKKKMKEKTYQLLVVFLQHLVLLKLNRPNSFKIMYDHYTIIFIQWPCDFKNSLQMTISYSVLNKVSETYSN